LSRLLNPPLYSQPRPSRLQRAAWFRCRLARTGPRCCGLGALHKWFNVLRAHVSRSRPPSGIGWTLLAQVRSFATRSGRTALRVMRSYTGYGDQLLSASRRKVGGEHGLFTCRSSSTRLRPLLCPKGGLGRNNSRIWLVWMHEPERRVMKARLRGRGSVILVLALIVSALLTGAVMASSSSGRKTNHPWPSRPASVRVEPTKSNRPSFVRMGPSVTVQPQGRNGPGS
jgi:hypothetical protein